MPRWSVSEKVPIVSPPRAVFFQLFCRLVSYSRTISDRSSIFLSLKSSKNELVLLMPSWRLRLLKVVVPAFVFFLCYLPLAQYIGSLQQRSRILLLFSVVCDLKLKTCACLLRVPLFWLTSCLGWLADWPRRKMRWLCCLLCNMVGKEGNCLTSGAAATPKTWSNILFF